MTAIKKKKIMAKSAKTIVTVTRTKTGGKAKTKAAQVIPAAKVKDSGVDALRSDIAALRIAVEKSLSPIASGALDEVDALRRVLGYLFESKTEEIIRALVVIRNASAALPHARPDLTEQIDALLANLGAVKFEAERLEYVDPLIHTITRDVRDEKLDDAVIVEAIRPGFRTARGVVIAKALVAINRRT
jgi:hypothetical protein